MKQGLYFGIVNEVDGKTARARVRLPDQDDAVTEWLAVGQQRTLNNKHYALPDVGEHVAVMLNASGEDGVVLCAIYSQADAPPVTEPAKTHLTLADGTVFEYDSDSHEGKIAGNCTLTLDVTTVHCTHDLMVGGKATLNEAEVTQPELKVGGTDVGPLHVHSTPVGSSGPVTPAP
jgi:phage baseplate assembly protein V